MTVALRPPPVSRAEFFDWAQAQEVLSPGSGPIDRIVKLQEYWGVPSIRRYVILEHSSAAITVLERRDGAPAWIATALTEGEIQAMPEIGIAVPVAGLYEDTGLGENVE